MKALTPALLALLFLLNLITLRAINRLPLKELKARSRTNHESESAAIHNLARYGLSARILLWLTGTVSLAILLMMAFGHSWWAGGLVILAANALVIGWQPVRGTHGWAWQLAATYARLFAGLLSLIRPLSEKLEGWGGHWQHDKPTETIYEKEDLISLLKGQSGRPDNRIDEFDLRRALHSLTFNDRTVGQVMLPKREVKWLAADEPIGPSIMDELHKTGQTRYPVVKSVSKTANHDIEGTLYIGRLLNRLGQRGKVRDLMSPGAYYVNEAASLEQALDAYVKTGSQLLIAVDGRGEVVGVLPIDTVLEQAFGRKFEDDFDGYDDPRRAADHEAGENPS